MSLLNSVSSTRVRTDVENLLLEEMVAEDASFLYDANFDNCVDDIIDNDVSEPGLFDSSSNGTLPYDDGEDYDMDEDINGDDDTLLGF